jgi:hypothetical protein
MSAVALILSSHKVHFHGTQYPQSRSAVSNATQDVASLD